MQVEKIDAQVGDVFTVTLTGRYVGDRGGGSVLVVDSVHGGETEVTIPSQAATQCRPVAPEAPPAGTVWRSSRGDTQHMWVAAANSRLITLDNLDVSMTWQRAWEHFGPLRLVFDPNANSEPVQPSPPGSPTEQLPRMFPVGSPEPGQSVRAVRAVDADPDSLVVFNRTTWGQWTANGPAGNGLAYSWYDINSAAVGTAVVACDPV